MSWRATKLKFLAAIAIRNGLGESGRRDEPSWPRYVRTTDIAGPRRLRNDVFASLPPDIARSAMLRDGDIVMTAAGATTGKSLLYQSDEPACYAGYLVRFRPTPDVDGRFVAYWTESQPYWDQIDAGKVVSTIENFSAGKYQNLRVSVPNLVTQRAIADYLDAETARIDAIIGKKQRMLQLLTEREITLIHELTARGARPADVIDSGVHWLGAVPKHWGVMQIRRIGDVRRGASPRPIDDPKYFDEEGEYSWVRIADVTGSGRYLTETSQRLSALGSSVSAKLAPGSLFISIAGSVGKPMIAKIKCCVHDGFVYFEHLRIRPDYLYYLFRASQLFQGLGKLGTQLNLNTDTIGTIVIPVPPLNEQDEIVALLDHRVDIGNRIRSASRREIDLLQQRRAALITAAVTGALDFPGKAA